MSVNAYSPRWYETFADSIPPEQTEAEVAFLAEWLPRERFPRILDACCGTGRHALALARLGYAVTGIDVSAGAIELARREAEASGVRVTFLECDIRTAPVSPSSIDGALIMWQSFGYFSDAENEEILGKIAVMLRSGGRLILDIYNREFFARNQGSKDRDVGGVLVTATTKLSGNRLEVSVEYGDGVSAPDDFEWRVYTENEIAGLGEKWGFVCVGRHADFSSDASPSAESPRMQIIFEKPG